MKNGNRTKSLNTCIAKFVYMQANDLIKSKDEKRLETVVQLNFFIDKTLAIYAALAIPRPLFLAKIFLLCYN